MAAAPGRWGTVFFGHGSDTSSRRARMEFHAPRILLDLFVDLVTGTGFEPDEWDGTDHEQLLRFSLSFAISVG